MTFFSNLEVICMLCSFRLVLEGKVVKEIPESSGLEFLEKFFLTVLLCQNWRQTEAAEAEGNISGLLHGGATTDLPLLRTILAIHQKYRESGFWEVIDAFVLILLQLLLLLVTIRSDFHELWQHHKQLKTMEMNEAYEIWSLWGLCEWDIYINRDLSKQFY